MSPMVMDDSRSNSGVQLPPRLSVRHSPPEAKATSSESGRDGIPSMSTMRPPWISGPTLRKRSPARGDAFSISSRRA